MVNKRFFTGMLVLTLVFGMTVACEAQSNKGGEFTLTNIPGKYDGKYVAFHGEEDDGNIEVYGADSIDFSKGFLKASRIKDGKVIIPIWITRDGKNVVRYSGNHSLDIELTIFNTPTDFDGELDTVFFRRVRFSNGNATESYDNSR